MNESWKQAEAEAHEAKAEAIQVALDALNGIRSGVDPLTHNLIAEAMAVLHRDAERHEKAAALARAKVPS